MNSSRWQTTARTQQLWVLPPLPQQQQQSLAQVASQVGSAHTPIMQQQQQQDKLLLLFKVRRLDK
jgi:hypothetical protein